MSQQRLDDEHIYFYLKGDKYGFMSNFYPSKIVIDDIEYPTVEHYYQSMKTRDGALSRWIADAPQPYMALMAGRALRPEVFRKDWEASKMNIMMIGLRAKFNQNPELAKMLLDTGDKPLHENSPTDVYWGIKGTDWLGQCLMIIRKELKKNVQ